MKKILACLVGAALAASLSACITVQAPAEDGQRAATPTPTLLPAEPVTPDPEPSESSADKSLKAATTEYVITSFGPQICELLDDPVAATISGDEAYSYFREGFLTTPLEGFSEADMRELAFDVYNGGILKYCPEHSDLKATAP